ncbi:hypothetical protein QV06_10115 [Gallibacterium genomosp. 3]|uniref:Autotransporter domain-containing protein n=1 Tax=Gallibacterium genomosp. 3 TaxID=505345 RepID=A0A1A7PKZ1_9PAST|nr:autotransporter domain-containing protein [Gallibacterium genomosp. 3]OBX03198.1 hypothetical protein QV06_10115 [Gallibacterium genomosp. 3]
MLGGGVKTVLSIFALLAMGTISYQAVAETVTISGADGISGTVPQRKASTDPVGSISTAGKVTNDTVSSRQSATIKGDTITIDGNQGATNTGIVKFIYEMGWGTDSNNSPINHNVDPNASYFRYLKLDNSHLLISNPTSSPEGKFRFDGLWAGAEAGKYASESTITLNNAEVLLNNSSSSGGLAVGPNSSVDINNSTFTSIFVRNIGTVNVTNSTLAVTQDVTTFEGFVREGELKGENVNTAQLGTFNFDNGVLESKYRAARPNDPGMFKGNLVLKNDTEIKVGTNSDGTIKKTFIQGGGVIQDFNGSKSAVNKTGAGTLVYTESNTYTGNTNVKEGTLQLGNEGGAVAGTEGTTGDIARDTDIVLSKDATLQIKRSNTYELNNKILAENKAADTGNLVQAGSGTTIISNKDNTFSGNTLIRGGVLQFENIESMGKGTTAISTGEGEDKGKLKINFTEDATIERNIDGTGEIEKTNTAKVTYTGSGTYTGKTTVSGGELEIASGGSIIGTSEVIIDDGKTYTEGQPVATLTVGGTLETAHTDNDYGDVTIDNGTLNVKNGGTVNVGNIKSRDPNTPEADTDKSTINIENGGSLTTNLINGDKLFENFKTDPGHEGIQIDGTLTAQVADKDATISQEDGAVFTGTGSFVKDGNGTLKLASGNTIGTTWVKDGTLDLDPDKTLKSTTVKVGDNKVADATDKEAAKTATFNVTGTVEGATDVSVDSDGYLKIGDDTHTGSISTTNLTVEGGSVDLAKGTATVSATTSVKDGTLNVAKGTQLTTVDLKAGDNKDEEGTNNKTNAFVNIDGTVTATGDITVKPDAKVTVGTDAEGDTPATAGTLAGKNLIVEGGSVDVVEGKTNITEDTDVKDGLLNVDKGATLTTKNLKAGDNEDEQGTNNKTNAFVNVNGTVTATEDITVKPDAKVIVGTDPQGSTPGTVGTLAGKNLTVEGGEVAVVEGNAKITENTDVQDGTLDVHNGATLTTKNLKAGDNSDDQKTGESINAHVNIDGDATVSGEMTVKPDAAVNVGTNDIPSDGDAPTKIGDTGSLKVNTFTMDGGTLDVNKGKLDAGTATVNGGTLTVDGPGTVNVGTVNPENGNLTTPKVLTLNGGTLDVAGHVNAENIVSNQPTDNDTDAIIKVQGGGELSLKPTGDKPLFDGFKQGDSDTIEVGGTLKVDVADGVNVAQNLDAPINPLTTADNATPVKGTLEKNGNGSLLLSAPENTLGKTVVHDGTLGIKPNSVLNSDTVDVGDSQETSDTAKLNIEGGLKATDVNVKPDGHLNIGTNADPDADTPDVKGTLETTNLTIDSGSVDLNVGKADIGTTNINDGTFTTDKGTTLDSDNINIGNNPDGNNKDGGSNTAKLQANGDVIAENVAVKSDGALDIGSNDNPKDKGKLTATNVTLDGGRIDLNNGETDIDTTQINKGKVTVDKGTTFDSDNINVGNNTNNNGDPASEAGIQIDGTVTTKNITVNPDGTLDVGTNDKAQTGTLKTDHLVLEGGPANINSGTVETPNDIVVNGTTLTIDKGTTVTTPNVITTDPIGEDTKPSAVNIAGTLNVSPADGAKLFDGFQTNPAKKGKDGLTVDRTGTLNITTPANGVVTQDPDTPIAGSGTINKKGPGELDILADNPFEGTVNIDEGTLRLTDNGKLGQATVNVNNDGTLAVDAPNTELGSLTMNPKSRFVVKATPDGVSELRVNGDLHLDGQFFTDVKEFKDSPDLDKIDLSRAVVSNTGGLTGKFTSYDDNSNLFDFIPDSQTNPNEIRFIVKPSKDDLGIIADRLGYERAKSIASALDSIFAKDPTGPLARLFYALFDDQQSIDAVVESLPALAGASSQVVADTSRHLANLAKIYDRCEDNVQQGDKHIWAKTFGSWGTQDQYQGAAGYRSESYGFAAGVEKCHQQTRLGAMIGYAYSHAYNRESVSNQTLRADTIQAGIYGNTSISSIADLDFRAGIGYSDVGTKRNIKFAKHTAQGNYGNKIGYAGVGVNFNAFSSEQAVIKPFIRLDYQVVRNNHYSERGAGVLNLNVDAGTNQSLVSQVGVDMKARLADKLSVNTRVGVGYDLVGEIASTRAAFAGAPDVKFTTQGAQHGRVSGELGIEMNYHITPAATLSVGYDASARKGYIEHTPNIMFKMAF